MESRKKPSIFVINPNSTSSMTKSLETMLAGNDAFANVDLKFTQPSTGPPSINNDVDGEESLSHCLAHLSNHQGFASSDAYLVACYSDHPLVARLRSDPAVSSAGKPVLGIFEASVLKSLKTLKNGESFGIISTGKVWETLLTEGVRRMEIGEGWARFAGVETTGLSAVELHDTPQEEVRRRMKDATKRLVNRERIGAVCLGCAGMAGMDTTVREALREQLGSAGDEVEIIDGVLAGVELLSENITRGTRS